MPRSRSFINTTPTICLPRRAKSLQFSYSARENRASLWLRAAPRVPLEIIDRIIELALENLTQSGAKRADFAHIKNLTSVSRALRYLTLNKFFRNLAVQERSDWSGLLDFLLLAKQCERMVGFRRTRHLTLSSKVLSQVNSPGKRTYHDISLHRLSNLRSLWCDFSAEMLVSQNDGTECLMRSISPGSGHSQLASLTMERVTRIDSFFLESIAKGLPSLVELHLSTTERIDLSCCWTCYEDSLTCISHSPIPGTYPNIEALATSFATALQSLQKLAHLSLGIFLSDESLVYSHIDQATAERQSVNAKTEDCFLCAEAATVIVRRELIATRILASTMNNLQTVEWSSFYAGKLAVKAKIHEVESIINNNAILGEVINRQDIQQKHYRFGGMKGITWINRSEGRVLVGRL